ncbi:replication-relaxation family protein [Prauserella flavalba]|uniref:replication-relaxation family protein n=1 Tax=Prauserella flavalba TaxID=1477506 RepID=UPI0036E21C05
MLNSTTPQRDLRAPVPERPTLRVASSPEHHAAIAGHLTGRDLWLARMLAEHRTLTSTQIVDLAFPSRRAANLRLQRLYQWRVVDRFQPYIGKGRAPMFYVLDITGAHALAHEDGIDPVELKFRPDRSIGIAYAHRLAHLHGVNSFFTPLIAHARAHEQLSVTAWWSEARCGRHFGDIVRPDAYGRWREDDREIEWFLEWDTGRYQLARFTAKLPGYAKLATTTRIITPLLACFATARREAHARRLLAEHTSGLPRPGDLPVATTNAEHLHGDATAAEAIWLPLRHTDAGRIRLINLRRCWPQVPTPTAASEATQEPADVPTPPRLTPPAPMPPWTDHDLTWRETG